MEYKRLGKSDLEASLVGLGTAFRRGISQDSVEIVRRALDLGVNLIDTAEIYQEGRSEEEMGKAIRGRRKDAIIVTKVSGEHLRYDDVLKAAEGSLRRLRIGTIDLYLVHWPNPNVPLKETMGAMETLVREGKVRYIGVSNFNVPQMREAQEALTRSELIANQVEYNIIKRDIEDEILPYCRREGIGIIAYSPLARGLLTGDYKAEVEIPAGHWRSKDALFRGESIAKNLKLVEALREIGAHRGKTAGQVALNWLVSKPEVFALFGASSVRQVEENCGAVGWRLTEEELNRIESIVKMGD